MARVRRGGRGEKENYLPTKNTKGLREEESKGAKELEESEGKELKNYRIREEREGESRRVTIFFFSPFR